MTIRRTVLGVAATVLLAACDQYLASGEPSPGGVTPALTPAPPTAKAVAELSACQAIGDAGATVTIETLRRVDRSCVPPSDAVVARCDPALDPIAILDAGSAERRTFLGGSYAVPVAEIPQRAEAIGFGPTGRYYLDLDDDRMLYLESGDRAERWLALPRPGRVGEAPEALMVGDSILDGSTDPLVAALPAWTLTIDALVGRTSSGGIAVVEGTSGAPDVVVVELGTNDHDADIFRANADEILAAPAVSGADLLVWVTVRNPDEAAPSVNRQIVAAVGTLPHATVADWDRAVPPEALNGDGVHLAPGNEGVFADFLAPILETWRAAVHRRGPASCSAAVLAALP
jgi:hypothetical protein